MSRSIGVVKKIDNDSNNKLKLHEDRLTQIAREQNHGHSAAVRFDKTLAFLFEIIAEQEARIHALEQGLIK